MKMPKSKEAQTTLKKIQRILLHDFKFIIKPQKPRQCGIDINVVKYINGTDQRIQRKNQIYGRLCFEQRNQ